MTLSPASDLLFLGFPPIAMATVQGTGQSWPDLGSESCPLSHWGFAGSLRTLRPHPVKSS